MFLKYDEIEFKFFDPNNEDLSNNYKKELEICEIFTKLIGDKHIFDLSLVNEDVEEIYLFLIEKAYKSEKEHHKFHKGIIKNADYQLTYELTDNVKKKIKIAFNKFIYDLFDGDLTIKYRLHSDYKWRTALSWPVHNYNSMLERRRINVDITFRCPLQCPRCQRTTSYSGKKVPGEDISIENFTKIAEYYNHICFCGQISDPCHHPKFIQLLQIAWENKCSVTVHHATGYKKMDWYKKAWAAHPEALWYFAIDGLPEESHKYRINQDGKHMYEILKESVNHLLVAPIWQYIVFKYNEDHIDEAMHMASSIGAIFNKVVSSRWSGPDDEFKPSKNNSLEAIYVNNSK